LTAFSLDQLVHSVYEIFFLGMMKVEESIDIWVKWRQRILLHTWECDEAAQTSRVSETLLYYSTDTIYHVHVHGLIIRVQ
jgi:hypothetical protein